MSDYPKQMLFITALSGIGRLIPVEVIGPNPRISGGMYIRYPEGGTDTASPDFLLDIPEGLAGLQARLQQAEARVAELEEAASWCEAENGDMQSLMALTRVVERGNSKAWLIRKQAEAAESLLNLYSIDSVNHLRLLIKTEADRLRQQAGELEAEDAGDSND